MQLFLRRTGLPSACCQRNHQCRDVWRDFISVYWCPRQACISAGMVQQHDRRLLMRASPFIG